jgi:hypothetical protein
MLKIYNWTKYRIFRMILLQVAENLVWKRWVWGQQSPKVQSWFNVRYSLIQVQLKEANRFCSFFFF